LIPHPDAIVHQSIKIEMAPGCRAIIYDAIAAGRIARGERWNFKEVRLETSIFMERQPVYINRSRITPETQPLHQVGWMQDFSYLATIAIVGEPDRDWSTLSANLNRVLKKCSGISGGVSNISGGSVVRFMASSASALTLAKHNVWKTARLFLLGHDAFEFRKY
jgi:urease accessory protein